MTRTRLRPGLSRALSRGMPILTPAQHDAIASALRTERDRLLASVSYLSADEATLVASQVSGENRVRSEGEGDVVAVERHLVAKLSEQARNALDEIESALRRLADGTYGLCEGCTGPIPAERLEVRPRTTLCVPCASRR